MHRAEPQSMASRSLGDIAASLPGATGFSAATNSISAAVDRKVSNTPRATATSTRPPSKPNWRRYRPRRIPCRTTSTG